MDGRRVRPGQALVIARPPLEGAACVVVAPIFTGVRWCADVVLDCPPPELPNGRARVYSAALRKPDQAEA